MDGYRKVIVMKKLLALSASLALLLLGLVAVSVAGCGNPSPADTINAALNNRQSSHVDFDTAIYFTLKPSEQVPEILGTMPITVSAKGGADMDLSNGKHNAKGDIKVSGLEMIRGALAVADILETQPRIGTALDAVANLNSFVMLDDMTYVRIGTTWYTADAGTLQGMLGPLGETLGSISSSTTDLDTQCFSAALQDTSRFGADTLFKGLTEMSGEQIDGVDTRHFKGSVDFEKILTELANVARDCGNAEAASGMEAGKSELGALFQTATVEFWIDSSNNLRQVQTDFVVNGSVAQTIIGILSGIGTAQIPGIQLDKAEFTNTSTFSQFGESFVITKPQQEPIGKLDDLLGAGVPITAAGGTAVPPGANSG